MTAALVLLARDATAGSALRSLGAASLVGISGLQLTNVTADSIRYFLVVPARFRATISIWPWISIFTIGRLLNMALPQSGTVFRAARLKVEYRIPVASFIGSVAAVTWLGNAVALLIAGALVANSRSVGLGLGILGLAALIVVALFGVPRLISGGSSRVRFLMPTRVKVALAHFGESFAELARGKDGLAVAGTSIVSQLAGAAAYVAACAAIGVDDPFLVGVVLYSGTTIATVVSLTPGGIGITELAAGVAAVVVNVSAGVGVLAALIVRATGLAALVLLALVAFRAERLAARDQSPNGDSR